MTLPVEFWGLLTAGIAVVASIAAHATLLRFAGRSFLAGLGASLAIGLGVVLALHAIFPPFTPLFGWDHAVQYAGDSILFICGWFVFLNFTVCSESSIRVRLLREISAAGGAIAETDLLAAYDEGSLIHMRLDRLLAGGQVKIVEGRYRLISRSILAIALLFKGLKCLILGRESEFG